jgi:drug/metabolite transporter (DMT)-like permease
LLKTHRYYYAGLCLVAIIWGANFGVSRWAMELFPPEIFVFLRFGLALPILFLVLKWSEGDIKVAKRCYRRDIRFDWGRIHHSRWAEWLRLQL